MKVFVLLLVVGLVSCDSKNDEDIINSGIKDLLSSDGDFTSKNDHFSSPSSGNPFDQSPPPAVVPADEVGMYLDGSQASQIPGYQYPRAPCVRHSNVRRVHPVTDDFVSDSPELQNRVCNREEYITRHFPVLRNLVSTTDDEKTTCQFPMVKRRPKYVVDLQTQHVPIFKTQVVPVEERYTQHVPAKKPYSRYVVDEYQTNVPLVHRRCRPFITHRVQHVPENEKRSSSAIHTELSSIPARHPIIRNVHTALEPCSSSEYPSSGYWHTGRYPTSENSWPSYLFTSPYSRGYCYPEVDASVTPSKSCNCGC